MGYDENEMMVEYAEMTAFNFSSKEYEEVCQYFIDCKEAARGFEWVVKNFVSRFKKAEA